MTETWKPLGCYQNRGRALDDILSKFKRFGKMQKKFGQCVTKANSKGVTLFGLDDTRCWTGQNAASSFGIYGTASGRCGSTKGGLRFGFLASETMFVYQKKGGKLLQLELQWTILITSSTKKHYSLDSEDDFRSGCRNVSHQQRSFSELPSPVRSHYTNFLPSVCKIWPNTIFFVTHPIKVEIFLGFLLRKAYQKFIDKVQSSPDYPDIHKTLLNHLSTIYFSFI